MPYDGKVTGGPCHLMARSRGDLAISWQGLLPHGGVGRVTLPSHGKVRGDLAISWQGPSSKWGVRCRIMARSGAISWHGPAIVVCCVVCVFLFIFVFVFRVFVPCVCVCVFICLFSCFGLFRVSFLIPEAPPPRPIHTNTNNNMDVSICFET